jgi:ATP diphosphatase
VGQRADLCHHRPYTLEETYEVLDAISREDFDDLRGELGDLLFQVVFYAQMAQEEGRFNFDDICAAISDKLERRHPHIFGDAPRATAPKCWPAGSRLKALSAPKNPSIPRWTTFRIACRR